MRTALVIIVLAAILLAWTAIRYRKQIVGLIGFVRMIRDAADPARTRGRISQEKTSVEYELVHCEACGTWVPRDRAIRFDAKTYYCSKDCVKSSLTTA